MRLSFGNLASSLSEELLITATGGTVTFFQSYNYHTFLNSGTFQITNFKTTAGLIECLVIGGGGAGGSGVSGSYGGGGGAGRVINARFSPSINSFSVFVGEGGSASTFEERPGGNGSSSQITCSPTNMTIIAPGGGGGGAGTFTGGGVGQDGGSGGGAGGLGYNGGSAQTGSINGATVVYNLGNNGGYSDVDWGAAGGGAENPGPSAINTNLAASGTALFDLWALATNTGHQLRYAAGGNGGYLDATGGSAGGGGGTNNNGSGQNGVANTGSGGGGGYKLPYYGGNGGKGIVIIRYNL